MARPIWPSSLPGYVLRPGYSEQPFWPRRSFRPELGVPISRPAGTVRMSQMSCTLVLSAPQVIIFEDFVWIDCGQGHLPFIGPRPRTQEQAVFKFDVEGEAPYKIDPEKGVTWRASFKLYCFEEDA